MVKDLVENRDGVPVTTSLKIKEYFEKDHDNVIKAIENIIADLKDIEESPSDQSEPKIGLIQKYFIKGSYKAGTGKNYKMYYVTEDGFNPNSHSSPSSAACATCSIPIASNLCPVATSSTESSSSSPSRRHRGGQLKKSIHHETNGLLVGIV